jgi:adenylyltransferase/sulfurtransferase
MAAEFTPEEQIRYSRHLILPEIGPEGQAKLKAARVLLVGAGGLGSPAALYLAAAGVGTLGIVDFDAVDLSNLHRQVIHGTPDVGRSKLVSASETLAAINPNVRMVPHAVMLTSENAMGILKAYDLVVDGTDNFPTRYLVNDACVLLGKPNVYGSILGFEGQASVFCAPGGPCYRCLYPDPPPPGVVPSCAEGGVLGVLPGMVGVIQATEAIKWIVGIGEPLVGRLLMYDALGMRFNEVRIRRDAACPVCGDAPTVTRLIDYDRFCGVFPPESKVVDEIGPGELIQMLDGPRSFTLLDVRTPREHAMDRIPGSILIPLAELPDRIDELDPKEPMVVYCRVGARSAHACALLMEHGFDKIVNLRGGIVEFNAIGGPVER